METEIKIGLIVVALGALWPTWLMLQRFIFRRLGWLLGLLVLVYTSLMVCIGVWIPFLLARGKTVTTFDLLTDFCLFGIMPIAGIALISYVLDHVSDWSHGVYLAAAGCLAVAVLPLAYYFAEDDLLKKYEIEIQPATVSGQASPGKDTAGSHAEEQ
jgi:MFS family permease